MVICGAAVIGDLISVWICGNFARVMTRGEVGPRCQDVTQKRRNAHGRVGVSLPSEHNMVFGASKIVLIPKRSSPAIKRHHA